MRWLDETGLGEDVAAAEPHMGSMRAACHPNPKSRTRPAASTSFSGASLVCWR
jgi:hypothetical protein